MLILCMDTVSSHDKDKLSVMYNDTSSCQDDPMEDYVQPNKTPHVQSRPNKELSILYFNARSLIPKFDELYVLAESQKPDIICVTETWLCINIMDNEISIPGYNVHRLDRNRHGGGILMYTSEDIVVSVDPGLSSNLEFFSCIH